MERGYRQDSVVAVQNVRVGGEVRRNEETEREREREMRTIGKRVGG